MSVGWTVGVGLGKGVNVGIVSGVGTAVGAGAVVDADREIGARVAVGNGVAAGTKTAVGNNVEVGVGDLVGTNVALGVGVGGAGGSSLDGVVVVDDSTSVTTSEGRAPSCPAHAIRTIPAATIAQPPLRVKRTGLPLRCWMEIVLVRIVLSSKFLGLDGIEYGPGGPVAGPIGDW